MISSLTPVFTFTLALVFAQPVGNLADPVAPSTGSGAHAQLDEKITLDLKDADLGQVLERLAIILGKTLILQPGVEGTVSIEVRETPISDVIARLQTTHGLSVLVKEGFVYVSKAGEEPRSDPGKADDEALNKSYLADKSLPRRLASDKPKRFGRVFEFKEENTGALAAWEIGDVPGTVTLPGCATPLAVSLLPGDAFDGVPRLVFGSSRTALPPGKILLVPARIVAPDVTFRLSDCSGPLTFRALDARDGIPKAVPLPQEGRAKISARILEVGAHGEDVISESKIQTVLGEVGSIQSGSQSKAPSGAFLNQTLRMSAIVLSAGSDDGVAACSITVTRDMEPEPGLPQVTIRIARADESLRLSYGKPERITVSPTYGRGHSALVLELTLDRVPGKR